MSGCVNVSDEILAKMVAKFGNSLSSLKICETKAGNKTLEALAEHCHSLQSLNISFCGNFSLSSFVKFFRNCLSLISFEASYCACITDEIIRNLLIHCEALTVLSVAGCKQLTSLCIPYLWLHGQNLSEVDFTHCASIPAKEFATVMQFLPVVKLKSK